jgi:hypothetical protein
LTLTLILTEDILKTAAESGSCVIFGQGYRTLEILVVSILSLEVPID